MQLLPWNDLGENRAQFFFRAQFKQIVNDVHHVFLSLLSLGLRQIELQKKINPFNFG